MKDIPVFEKNSLLVIASVPERGSVADVLVSKGDTLLKDLKEDSKIGTTARLTVGSLML